MFMRTTNNRYWLFQICGWGIVGGVMLFFAHVFDVTITTSDLLTRIFIVMAGGIFSTHILRLFIKWKGWLMQPIEKVIPWLMIAMVIMSMFYSLLVLGAVDFFIADSSKKLPFLNRLVGSTVDNGLFILPWTLIYYFYHFIEKSRRQQMDTLQLESLIKELELKTIKAHINPHFIFNSLNSIRALVDENPERARKAITELSNILRSSMQADKSETVTLEKELFIVKDYLALENMRFEDRLRIEYEVDEETLDQQVPPMMLQTLVENAIKHGISKQINGGVVRVSSVFKDGFHELSVQNTGRLNGAANPEHGADGRGFGLSSTTDRLTLLYGNKAKFEIKQSTATLVEARVLIPIPAEHSIR
jgi:sensor histidine kinase YesM